MTLARKRKANLKFRRLSRNLNTSIRNKPGIMGNMQITISIKIRIKIVIRLSHSTKTIAITQASRTIPPPITTPLPHIKAINSSLPIRIFNLGRHSHKLARELNIP